MGNLIKHHWNTTVTGGLVTAVLNEPISENDENANEFSVTVQNANFESATCKGFFIRGDGMTIILDGEVSGNTASVVLAPNCYNVTGRFTITVKVEKGDSTTSWLRAEGYVKATSTDDYALAGDDSAPLDLLLEAAERVDEAVSEANEAAAAANEAAQAAENALESVEETLDAIQEDYTELAGEVGQLSEEVLYPTATLEDYWNADRWEAGSIQSDGHPNTSDTALRTKGYDDIGPYSEIVITAESGYNFGLHIYDSNLKSVYNSEQWETGTVKYGCGDDWRYMRINARKSEIDSDDYFEWLSHYSIAVTKNLKEINDKITSKQLQTIDDALNLIPYDFASGAVWEVGSIGSGGNDVSKTNTIRTGLIFLGNCGVITCNAPTDYEYGVHLYDANCLQIFAFDDYKMGETNTPVPDDAVYLRINMRTVIDQTADIAWGEMLSVNGFSAAIAELVSIKNTLRSNGNTVYVGERLNLTEGSVGTSYCDINLWEDFDATENSGILAYSLEDNQSMTIYGGYVFLLLDGGSIVVADHATKEIIGMFDTPVMSINHNNSAQFTDIFFEDEDEFPLLLVSRCGNTKGVHPGYDTCLVYRIQRMDTTFTFTHINTISSDVVTYGSDWSVDNTSRELVLTGYVVAPYTTEANNPIMFYRWKMPSKSDIVSGAQIELKESDITGFFKIDYALLQSAATFAGVTYIGVGASGAQHVYAVHMSKKTVVAKIPAPISWEIEGIAVYQGKLYFSQRQTDSNNPLRVYEVTP